MQFVFGYFVGLFGAGSRFDVCSIMICFTFTCLVIYDGFGVVWLSGLVCLVVGGWLMFRLWLLNSVVFGMCSCWYIICLICLFGFFDWIDLLAIWFCGLAVVLICWVGCVYSV